MRAGLGDERNWGWFPAVLFWRFMGWLTPTNFWIHQYRDGLRTLPNRVLPDWRCDFWAWVMGNWRYAETKWQPSPIWRFAGEHLRTAQTSAAQCSFTVPRIPVSPNSLRGRHWSVKHKDKRDWEEQIMVKAPPSFPRLTVNNQKRCKVRIVVFTPYHPFDPDNLHGAIKPILDALKTNGLIFDDSLKWLDYFVMQVKVGTIPELRTAITVKVLDPEVPE